MTQEQKTAVFKLTLESLTKDREEWMPWILELDPIRLGNLLMEVLKSAVMSEQQEDRILVLLGTFAETLTEGELETWAPRIVLARNRTLAARMPLPPE